MINIIHRFTIPVEQAKRITQNYFDNFHTTKCDNNQTLLKNTFIVF